MNELIPIMSGQEFIIAVLITGIIFLIGRIFLELGRRNND